MVGRSIKAYLEAKGIRQTFVAKKSGLTDGQMSDICNGKVKLDIIVYYRICKALEVPLDTFVNDDILKATEV